MSKAILVIDMPSCCGECPIHASYADSAFSIREYWCATVGEDVNPKTKPDWCPLKMLPEKYEIDKNKCCDPFYEFEFEYGYNQCIDEILRGDRICTD